MSERYWRGWQNAEEYGRFIAEHRVYSWLNQRLVERAALETAHRVLDLGCGTGATTRACLARLPPEAEVVGLDGSEEMVGVARATTLDPRARFVVAEAASLAEAVEGRFARAVSNAAFWQFPHTARVLAGLRERLEPGGLFVFNVPAERVGGAPFHPFQLSLARAIEEATGEPFTRMSTTFSPGEFRTLAAEHGLVPQAEERLTYVGRQGEFMALMGLPAMIAPLTPGLSEEAREQLLARARAEVEPEERVRVDWCYFTFRREG